MTTPTKFDESFAFGSGIIVGVFVSVILIVCMAWHASYEHELKKPKFNEILIGEDWQLVKIHEGQGANTIESPSLKSPEWRVQRAGKELLFIDKTGQPHLTKSDFTLNLWGKIINPIKDK